MVTPTPNTLHRRKWVTGALLVVYAAVVLTATMWPTPIDRGRSASIGSFLDRLHGWGLPGWFDYSTLEASANVAMFVPLALLLTLLLPTRAWWVVLLACPFLSVTIELTQLAVLPARFATISDVIANSTGAVIGVAAALVLRGALRLNARRRIAARARATGPRFRVRVREPV
ncbi:MAG: VanZ family protein [Burkholderiaceae bacterium]|nr:VanZ family protein [Microbacteriaceae bacterium]